MKLSILIISLLILSGCITADKAEKLASSSANANNTTSSGGEASYLGFVITAITPSAGSVAGNYNVTISGSQFDATTTFTIGGIACLTVTIISNSSAVCKVPAGIAGVQDVVAIKTGKTNTLTGGFQYVGAAGVTSVSPAIVPATTPTLLTITGTNFITGATVNIFHPSMALTACQTVIVVNSTTITCYSPSLSAAQSHTIKSSGILSSVIVTNADGTQISLNNSLDFTPAPQYSSMSFAASGVTAPPTDGVLNNGISAYTLTINGNYFTAGVTVKVDSTNAGSCSFVSSSQISCTALPALASIEGNYTLQITNPDGQIVTQSILFARKPTITSTTPTNVRTTGGDNLVINGSGLGLNPTMEIYNNANTVLLGTCTLSTSSPLSCTTPALAAQATTFRLRNDYGYRTTYNPLNFVVPTTLTLTSYEIGRVTLGSSYTHKLILTNPSTTVTATAISIDTSLISSPFTYVSTNCAGSLTPASYCEISFTYAPTSLKIQTSGLITVTYNDGVNSQTVSKRLVGWGTTLEVLMRTIDYGTIPYGNNHAAAAARFTKPIVLINRGKSSVTISSVSFSSGTEFTRTPLADRFNLASPLNYECGATLAAGEKCVLSIDFIPTSAGAKSDTFTITYNTSYTRSISLTGTGGSATKTTCNPASTTYNAHGSGTNPDPWLICSEAQFHDLVSKTQSNTGSSRSSIYLQTADITFASSLANPVFATTNFSYNGGGYRLINPVLNNPGVDYRGIFYSISTTAGLNNVQAYNSTVVGGYATGSLSSLYLSIVNSYAYGNVTGTTATGGIYGDGNANASITKSYFLGEVNCTTQLCGGLGGWHASIQDSFTHGKITGGIYTGGIISATYWDYSVRNVYSTMQIVGTSNAGGIVGHISTDGLVQDTVSYGNVAGSTYVGGIIGFTNVRGSVTNSFFGGDVSGTSFVGGILGGSDNVAQDAYGIVRTSVSSGTVTASTRAGGIIGSQNIYNNVTISDSFNLSTISVSTYGGGLMGRSAYAGTGSDAFARSYVATATGGSLFTTANTNSGVIAPLFTGTYSALYLTGIATDQTQAGVRDVTDAQLQTQASVETLGGFDFTVGPGKWKYSTRLPTDGYPYPMLQWMNDDWMP